MALDISYASVTNKGERTVNEDSLGTAITKDIVSFILCDGLGGHGNGDVASAFVVGQMQKNLEKAKSIEESILLAQNALLKKQIEENAGDSMKTTVTCLSLSNTAARFGHVGDSRIYYFEKAKYKLRSQDHSIPQMLVNRGDIKEKDIRHHEDRSRLLRVMGTAWNTPKYQMVDNIPLTKHTSFLLCSDGFWELIDEKMMCKTLKKAPTPDAWLKAMEEILWKNGRGTNMDNYSAVAVFVR
ncbi:MAG: serine/threonine-protein phosphatase [Lachnospiraceae bacterium]|nr:serine/threonine-protein phosphatase [Lachnospiraceae bacterium]